MPGQVRILRLRQTDASKDHILLRVGQASVSRPLDLKLIATEHEHLYHGEVKGTEILSIKADRFSGDEDELRDVLCFCFLQDRPDGAEATTLQGLEMVATLEQTAIILTVRRRVGGITPRIAAIRLVQDDEREEVSPFDWLDTAVSISDELRRDVDKLDTALTTQREETAKLKQRLDELVQLKKDNEAEMMQKFVALLNTKKRRIREQQLMLDGIDTSAARQAVRDSATKSKRKAEANEQDDDDVEMDDAEADGDVGDQDDAEDQEDLPTTPPATDSDDNAADDLDSEPARDSKTSLPHRKSSIAQTGHATRSTTAGSVDAPPATSNDDYNDDTDDEL